MRNIRELLQILLDNLNMMEDGGYTDGLCIVAWLLFIDSELIKQTEYYTIIYYIQDTFGIDDNQYAFPAGEIEPRREWLIEQINSLKEQTND